jgi:hypothetical protein
MKLLEEDPAETTRDILYTISQQLANNSIPPFPQITYETPQYAVVLNGLFFTSLSCSLIAALLAVLALQWVANYDMGLNTSSARKRALQRHTRWTGIEKWKMGEIIASLPLLIFVSLFLFFTGIADWLWHLNRAISAIVMGGIGLGSFVYSITTIISIAKLEAPFRTPVSKGFAPLIRHTLVWMKLLFFTFPSEAVKQVEEWPRIRWSRIKEIWNGIYSRTTVPPPNFAKCEESSIEGKDEKDMESLVWLANSIEITPTSRAILLALIKEVVELPGELLLRKGEIDRAPWEPIFTELCTPYFGKRSIDEYTGEDAKNVRDICKAFSMISSGIISPTLSAFFGSLEARDPSTNLAIQLSRYRHLRKELSSLYSALFVACASISSMEDKFFHFLLLSTQQAWPDLRGNQGFILKLLNNACTTPSGDTGDPYPIPIKSLRVILDLVGRQSDDQSDSIDTAEESTLISRYLSAVKRMNEGQSSGFGNPVHRGIQKQLLVHISVIDFSFPSAIKDLAAPLELLLQLISSRPTALIDGERDKFVHLLIKIHAESLDEEIKEMVEKSLLSGLEYSYGTDDQPLAPQTSLILAINEYLEGATMQSQEDYPYIINAILRSPPLHGLYSPENFLRDTLIRIKDPSIALWLMGYCPSDWHFEALLNPDVSQWTYHVINAVFRVLMTPEDLASSDLCISLLRAMIMDGTDVSLETTLVWLKSYYGFNTPEQVIGLMTSTSRSFINLFISSGNRWSLHQF